MKDCSVKGLGGRAGHCAGWLLVLLVLCLPLHAETPAPQGVVVIYPQVREPFAALYRDYLAGIRQVVPSPREYRINGNEMDRLAADVVDAPPDVMIVLGNKSVRTAASLGSGRPLVGLVANEDYRHELSGGVLLKPSAEVYLDNLRAIHGGVRHIFVVYNPETQQDLVDEAAVLAKRRGMTLEAFRAANIREAAAKYRRLLGSAEAYSAVWLLPNNDFVDASLLSTILQVAWERRLIVFSSNPQFVKHGALFAIYPDNQAVGGAVSRIALAVAQGDSLPLEPLREVRLAVNERTLNHLSLSLSPEVRERIDLMLPGR